MEPITLAAVTSAVVSLAIEAAKEVASQAAKDSWNRVKLWLGWTDKTPPMEDLATTTAKSLEANPTLAEQIIHELQRHDTGAPSKIAAKLPSNTKNEASNNRAGNNVITIQGITQTFGSGTVIGGGRG